MFPAWWRPMWLCVGCLGAILIWLGIHVEHIGWGWEYEGWRARVADACDDLGDVMQDVGVCLRSIAEKASGRVHPIPDIWNWDDL